MLIPRSRYILLMSSAGWFSALAWAASDGSRPEAIIDIGNNRVALPRGLTATNIPAASVAQLTTLKSGAFSDLLSVSSTRTSTASSYVDSDGVMKFNATSDVPRFTWLGGKRRLVVDPASTNLRTYSQELGNAAWAKTSCTVTDDVVTAPDGTMTGDKIVYNSGALGYVSQNNPYSFTSGSAVAISHFYKAAERSSTSILVSNGAFGGAGANGDVVFDLVALTVTPARSEVSGTITDYGNGWFRCVAVVVPTATATANIQFGRAQSNGDGSAGIYAWGAQMEALAFATSYIPTTSATVTRAAEIVTGTALFNALMRRPTGTNVTRYLQLEDPTLSLTLQQLWTFGGDSGNSRLGVRKTQNGGVEGPRGVVGNGTSVTTHVPGANAGANPGDSIGVALAWDTTNSRMALKGALVGSDGNAWDSTVHGASTFTLIDTTTYKASLLIDQIVLYPTRVSNAALPGLAVAA